MNRLLSFLRRIWGTPHVPVDPSQPAAEPGSPFAVRAVPFDERVTHYCIEYTLNGLAWHRFEYAFLCFDNPSLWSLDQPYLYRQLDDAVAAARGLTPEGIKEHNAEQRRLYHAKHAAAKARIAERTKTVYVQGGM